MGGSANAICEMFVVAAVDDSDLRCGGLFLYPSWCSPGSCLVDSFGGDCHVVAWHRSQSTARPRGASSRLGGQRAQGADNYSIGVGNEVDMLVWRQNNIPTNSVTRPDDVPLDAGTYFWSVSALRNGEELADSGLSAFVVRTSP
jgi:hypothetical protein